MGYCPECKKEIDHLKVRYTYTNHVELIENDIETTEKSGSNHGKYICPECDSVLTDDKTKAKLILSMSQLEERVLDVIDEI